MNFLPSLFQFHRAAEKADEVKQGGNHYQGAVYQAVQYSHLPTVTSPLLDRISNPQLRIIMKLFNHVIPVASWIICPTAAAIKQGHYEIGVKIYNQMTKDRFKLISKLPPSELKPQTKKAYNFIAKHAGHIAEGGMIVSSVALAFLGSPYFAAALATQYSLKKMNQAGLFPKQFSLLMEEKLPIICDACLIFSGNIVNQVISGLTILSSSQKVNEYVQTKVDSFTHEKVGLEGPKLEEIDAEVKTHKHLPFNQILFLLNLDKYDFAINPAHCSKPISLTTLAEDADYGYIIEVAKLINWKLKTPLLRFKFRDDERFNDFLSEKFIELNNYDVSFDDYLGALMIERNEDLEDLLANQFTKQLQGLVDILNGVTPGIGSLADLDESRKNCRKIVAFLKNLSYEKNKIIFEDILLKLGVEAGEFCNRGIKRASGEIVDSILREKLEQKNLSDHTGELQNEMDWYELKLLQSLQFYRSKILDNTYLKFMENVVASVKNPGGYNYISGEKQTKDIETVAFAQDVHTRDLYRVSFALGFYPLLDYERKKFGLGDLVLWSHPGYPFRAMRNHMYQIYFSQVQKAFKDAGKIYFGDYLRRFIYENQQLKDNEKAILLNLYTGDLESEINPLEDHALKDFINNLTSPTLSLKEIDRKFKKLILFGLGVIKLSPRGIEKEKQFIKQNKEQQEMYDCLSDWVEVLESADDHPYGPEVNLP